MPTEIINYSNKASYENSRARLAEALRNGKLVVFPTETVYGVAANAASAEAMQRLRSLKGRTEDQPFTVHIGHPRDARLYVPKPSILLRRLVRKGWPGPLTLICESGVAADTEIARVCPPEQLGEIFHKGTVGLRCPDHRVCEELLSDAQVPVVASSANRTGHAPPTDFRSALNDLNGLVEFAIDGGRTRLNAASTIVQVRGNRWEVRRAGALDERTIQRFSRSMILFVCTGNSCRSPLAEHLFLHKLSARLSVPTDDLAALGYVVLSAGTFASPGGAASGGTVEQLANRGIRADRHRSRPLTIELIQQAERIYAMSPEHRAAVLDLVPAAEGRVHLLDREPIADPVGGSSEDYRRCAEQIERAVDVRLEEFLHEDLDW